MFLKALLLLSCLLAKAYGQRPLQQPAAGYPGLGYGQYAAPISATAYQGYAGYAPPPQPYGYGYEMMDQYGHRQLRSEDGDYRNARSGPQGYQDAYGLHGRVNYGVGNNIFRPSVAVSQPGTAPVNNANLARPPVPAGTSTSKTGPSDIGYGATAGATSYDSAYRRHNEYGYKPYGDVGASYGAAPYAGYGYAPGGVAFSGPLYGMPSPYGYGGAAFAGGQFDPLAYGGTTVLNTGAQGYRRR